MKLVSIVLVGLGFVASAKADTYVVPPGTEPFSVRVSLRTPRPASRIPGFVVPTKQPLPEFPLRLRSAKIMGDVVVAFTVEADGKITGLRVVKGSEKEFEEAVLAAVAQWRFSPTRTSKGPVSTALEYVFVFQMHDE